VAARSTGQARPQRTCVGCRARADAVDLIRVVAVEGACVPDPRGRLPGRGAHLHLDRSCLAAAERRRAWTRALRIEGPLDTGPVRQYIEDRVQDRQESPTDPESGLHG
jgi:predicted RNA-binding protein YlxR (DUF448 family)